MHARVHADADACTHIHTHMHAHTRTRTCRTHYVYMIFGTTDSYRLCNKLICHDYLYTSSFPFVSPSSPFKLPKF